MKLFIRGDQFAVEDKHGKVLFRGPLDEVTDYLDWSDEQAKLESRMIEWKIRMANLVLRWRAIDRELKRVLHWVFI